MQKLTKIKLLKVHYVPKVLEPGILYVSEEFGAALHLCACGCGSKVSTPIGPTDWRVEETDVGPTLFPSVGSWQLPCRSHYYIYKGEIDWCGDWSQEQIIAGRKTEEKRHKSYFEKRAKKRGGRVRRAWKWVKNFFE